MIESLFGFTTLVGITCVAIILMFLPAVVELKKPQDAGPRLILDFQKRTLSHAKLNLTNIEEEFKLENQQITRMTIIHVMENLEASPI